MNNRTLKNICIIDYIKPDIYDITKQWYNEQILQNDIPPLATLQSMVCSRKPQNNSDRETK